MRAALRRRASSRLILRVLCRTAAILGLGLLGGSLGMALRRRGLASEVRGYARRAETVREAIAAGAVDRAGTGLDEALEGADLVVVCTPVSQMGPLLGRATNRLAPGAVVTDVGSVKAAVVEVLEPLVREAGGRFVGSHPMAGSERTGVGAAREDLFSGAMAVVTPTPGSDGAAVDSVCGLWEAVGSRVLRMTPARHDELVARSSHLPHFVAAALAGHVLAPEFGEDQGRLCATGFRDTTRVASGSPEMWRDIALGNAGALLAALDGLGAELDAVRAMVKAGDGPALEAWLRNAKARRDAWKGAGAGAGGGGPGE